MRSKILAPAENPTAEVTSGSIEAMSSSTDEYAAGSVDRSELPWPGRSMTGTVQSKSPRMSTHPVCTQLCSKVDPNPWRSTTESGGGGTNVEPTGPSPGGSLRSGLSSADEQRPTPTVTSRTRTRPRPQLHASDDGPR